MSTGPVRAARPTRCCRAFRARRLAPAAGQRQGAHSRDLSDTSEKTPNNGTIPLTTEFRQWLLEDLARNIDGAWQCAAAWCSGLACNPKNQGLYVAEVTPQLLQAERGLRAALRQHPDLSGGARRYSLSAHRRSKALIEVEWTAGTLTRRPP